MAKISHGINRTQSGFCFQINIEDLDAVDCQQIRDRLNLPKGKGMNGMLSAYSLLDAIELFAIYLLHLSDNSDRREETIDSIRMFTGLIAAEAMLKEKGISIDNGES